MSERNSMSTSSDSEGPLPDLRLDVRILPDLTVSGSPIDEGYCSSRSPERMSVADLARHLSRQTIRQQQPPPTLPDPSYANSPDQDTSDPISRPTTPQRYFQYIREERQAAARQESNPAHLQRVTHLVRRALDYGEASSSHRFKKKKQTHSSRNELSSLHSPGPSTFSSLPIPPSSPEDNAGETIEDSETDERNFHSTHRNAVYTVPERKRVSAVERTARMRKRVGDGRRDVAAQ